MRKDIIAVGGRKFQCMVTVSDDQIDFFIDILGTIQVEKNFLIGRILKAIAIHVFDEVLDLEIHALIKGCPHCLFGENVARHILLARN